MSISWQIWEEQCDGTLAHADGPSRRDDFLLLHGQLWHGSSGACGTREKDIYFRAQMFGLSGVLCWMYGLFVFGTVSEHPEGYFVLPWMRAAYRSEGDISWVKQCFTEACLIWRPRNVNRQYGQGKFIDDWDVVRGIGNRELYTGKRKI